jgi:hypothetical protein
MTVQSKPLLDGVVDHLILVLEAVKGLADITRRLTEFTTLGPGPRTMRELNVGLSSPILDPCIMTTNHDAQGISKQDVTMLSRHTGYSLTWNQEPGIIILVSKTQHSPMEHTNGITIRGAATTKMTIGIYGTKSQERIADLWNFLADRTGPSEDAILRLSLAIINVARGMRKAFRGGQCTNPVPTTTMKRAFEVKDAPPTLGGTSPLPGTRSHCRSLIMIAFTIPACDSLAMTVPTTTAPDATVTQETAPISVVVDTPMTIQA